MQCTGVKMGSDCETTEQDKRIASIMEDRRAYIEANMRANGMVPQVVSRESIKAAGERIIRNAQESFRSYCANEGLDYTAELQKRSSAAFVFGSPKFFPPTVFLQRSTLAMVAPFVPTVAAVPVESGLIVEPYPVVSGGESLFCLPAACAEVGILIPNHPYAHEDLLRLSELLGFPIRVRSEWAAVDYGGVNTGGWHLEVLCDPLFCHAFGVRLVVTGPFRGVKLKYMPNCLYGFPKLLVWSFCVALLMSIDYGAGLKKVSTPLGQLYAIVAHLAAEPTDIASLRCKFYDTNKCPAPFSVPLDNLESMSASETVDLFGYWCTTTAVDLSFLMISGLVSALSGCTQGLWRVWSFMAAGLTFPDYSALTSYGIGFHFNRGFVPLWFLGHILVYQGVGRSYAPYIGLFEPLITMFLDGRPSEIATRAVFGLFLAATLKLPPVVGVTAELVMLSYFTRATRMCFTYPEPLISSCNDDCFPLWIAVLSLIVWRLSCPAFEWFFEWPFWFACLVMAFTGRPELGLILVGVLFAWVVCRFFFKFTFPGSGHTPFAQAAKKKNKSGFALKSIRLVQ